MSEWKHNRQGLRPVLCIAGPTASGKSGAAVALAKRVDGEIINADSMQVYSDLHIISARPTHAEMDGVPHHLFGHVDGSERYSTGRWLSDAQEIMLDVLSRHKTPILVGGTGLYFKALLEGLAQIPEPGKAARAAAQSYFEAKGIEALRSRAEKLDPLSTANVLPNDPQRLIRIISVTEGTGKPLSSWQKDTRPVLAQQDYKAVRLLPDRAALYDRINKRFDDMVAQGGREEAKKLLARGLSPELPVMKAIGVRELLSDDANAIEMAKQQSRRYAKRQYTWFNNQTPDWPMARDPYESIHILENFFSFMTLT